MQLALYPPEKIAPENDLEMLNRAWAQIDDKNYVRASESFAFLNKRFPGIFDINLEIVEKRGKEQSRSKNFRRVPIISIIIPVYNNAIYLEECFNSVLNQTLRQLEIIIVNDGSTDPAVLNILDRYARLDGRIRLINKKNSGYGHSVNIGLDMAWGEYIGIVESDDYIHPRMYEILYRHAQNNAADAVKCDFSRFVTHRGENLFETVSINKNDDFYYKVIKPEECPELLRMYTLNQNGIYKKEYIRENCIYLNETPGASYQDNGLFFQLLMFAKSVYCIKDSLYYLRRDNEQSSVFSRHKVFAGCKEYSFIKKIILNNENLRQKFFNIFFAKKYSNYQFTLRRISPEFIEQFFYIFSKEFKDSLENKEFDENSLTENEWQGLQKLFNKKNKYLNYKITHPAPLHFLEDAKKARDEYLWAERGER